MIELDIINPSETLSSYIMSIWPKDFYMYVYKDGEHYYISCDHCAFWDGNYTLTLSYYKRAFIRLSLYKGEFEQVRNITKNKRRLY